MTDLLLEAVNLENVERVRYLLSRADPILGFHQLWEDFQILSADKKYQKALLQKARQLLDREISPHLIKILNREKLRIEEQYQFLVEREEKLIEILKIFLSDPRIIKYLLETSDFDWLLEPILQRLVRSSDWRSEFQNYYSRYLEAPVGSLQFLTFQKLLQQIIKDLNLKIDL